MAFREWKEYIFSEFVNINPPIRLDISKEYSFIEMKDLDESKKNVYPSAKRKPTGGARFQDKDTLFARITPCLENGKICQAKGLEDGVGFGSTEFLVFRGINGISDTDFVYYLSRYNAVRRFAEQNLLGTSGRQRVNREAFQKLNLALPPIKIQKKIASILSSIDDKIEINRQTNATLEQVARTIFNEWFVDFNFPNRGERKKLSELGEIPSDWEVNGIGEISLVQNGYAFKSNDFTEEGEVGIIKIKNINGNVVDITDTDFVDSSIVEKLDSKFKIRSGAMLIAMTGAQVGKIGLVPITEKQLWLNQRVGMFIEKIPFGNLFMYLLLSSDTYQNAIQNSALGSAQPNISGSTIEGIRAVIPKTELIEKFGRTVNPMFEKILLNLAENEALKNTRDSLLQKLLNGEIEVE